MSSSGRTASGVQEKPRSTDRRVQRTRRTLRESLVTLILERGWDEISVLDVCDHADVGRSTFYLHFGDKEQLLLSGFDDLKRELRAKHTGPSGDGSGALGFAGDMIEHARDNQRLFRALIGQRSALAVQRRFRQLVLDLVEEDLARIAPRSPRLDMTAHYVAGAFIELLMWWLDARTTVESGELEEHFHRLTVPVIEKLRR